jgi:hypothetical protein
MLTNILLDSNLAFYVLMALKAIEVAFKRKIAPFIETIEIVLPEIYSADLPERDVEIRINTRGVAEDTRFFVRVKAHVPGRRNRIVYVFCGDDELQSSMGRVCYLDLYTFQVSYPRAGEL